MFKRRLIILGILSIFCIAITTGLVSANENVTEVVSLDQNIDDELQVNELNELKETYSDSTLNEENEINSGGDDLLEMYNDDSEVISSENSNNYTIKKIEDTNIYLVEPINEKECYVLDSISNYPNMNTKFIIKVFPSLVGENMGSVTLKFNGNYYHADIYGGDAIIFAKTPSKPGKYRATLSYSGFTYVVQDSGFKYNPSSSTFILNVKENSVTVSVKAPKITAHYKAKKYFKVTVRKDGNPVKSLKLKVKVYTGKKYKTYTIKTNKKGIAKLSTKKFKIGSHKVKITSKNKKYNVKKTSKIKIKKAKKKYPLGSKQNPRKKINYNYFTNHQGELNKYYKDYFYIDGTLYRDDNKYNIGAGTFTYISGKNPYA